MIQLFLIALSAPRNYISTRVGTSATENSENHISLYHIQLNTTRKSTVTAANYRGAASGGNKHAQKGQNRGRYNQKARSAQSHKRETVTLHHNGIPDRNHDCLLPCSSSHTLLRIQSEIHFFHVSSKMRYSFY